MFHEPRTGVWPSPMDPYLQQMQQMKNLYASARADPLKRSIPLQVFPAPRPTFGRRLAFAFLSPCFLIHAGILWGLSYVAVFGGWVERVWTAACLRTKP